jgi:hypothetical protein
MLLTTGILSSATEISKNKEKDCNDSFDGKNYYAVLIGCEEFLNPDLFPMEEPIEEAAIAFYEKLLNSENWKEENIKFILNKNATKEKIHDAITIWLNEKEKKDDIVLIYVATHGWKIDKKNRTYGNAYFFTYNSTSRFFNEDKETKITDKELDSWLDELDSKHIAVILEHCYSGRMLELRNWGRTVLTAGGLIFSCPVNYSMFLNDSIFGFFLKQGLDGVSDINNDGWVTLREAFHYLRFPVIWYSFWYNFPFIGKWNQPYILPQVPFIYDRHLGKIPFYKYKV